MFPRGKIVLILMLFLVIFIIFQHHQKVADPVFDVRKSNVAVKHEHETEPKCFIPGLQSIDQYWEYFTNIEIKCSKFVKFGGHKPDPHDTRKDVCMDERMNIKPGNCIILSFGINNQWTFEDDFDKFGCKIYAFDPTMSQGDHDRSPNIKFRSVGISNFKGEKKIGSAGHLDKWTVHKVDRLENLINDFGLAGKEIDYLKLDVELSEIDFLQDVLFNSLHVLKNVKQIAMEIHHGYFEGNLNPLSTHQIFWLYLQLLKCHGFKMMQDRPAGPWREVVWAQDKQW